MEKIKKEVLTKAAEETDTSSESDQEGEEELMERQSSMSSGETSEEKDDEEDDAGEVDVEDVDEKHNDDYEDDAKHEGNDNEVAVMKVIPTKAVKPTKTTAIIPKFNGTNLQDSKQLIAERKAAAVDIGGRDPNKRPATKVLVNTAIKNLNERSGSSLIAIRKYIVANYDGIEENNRLNIAVKKYLKDALVKGWIIQTKGTGATGSFKLSADAVKPRKMHGKEKKPKVVSQKKLEKDASSATKEIKSAKAIKAAKTITKVSKPQPTKATANSKSKIADSNRNGNNDDDDDDDMDDVDDADEFDDNEDFFSDDPDIDAADLLKIKKLAKKPRKVQESAKKLPAGTKKPKVTASASKNDTNGEPNTKSQKKETNRNQSTAKKTKTPQLASVSKSSAAGVAAATTTTTPTITTGKTSAATAKKNLKSSNAKEVVDSTPLSVAETPAVAKSTGKGTKSKKK